MRINYQHDRVMTGPFEEVQNRKTNNLIKNKAGSLI